MSEVECFIVILANEDDKTTTIHVKSSFVSHNSDLGVGTYTISVCSENSVGCSEAVSTSLGMYIQVCAEMLLDIIKFFIHNVQYLKCVNASYLLYCSYSLPADLLYNYTICTVGLPM